MRTILTLPDSRLPAAMFQALKSCVVPNETSFDLWLSEGSHDCPWWLDNLRQIGEVTFLEAGYHFDFVRQGDYPPIIISLRPAHDKFEAFFEHGHSFPISGFFGKKLSMSMPYTVGKPWLSSFQWGLASGGKRESILSNLHLKMTTFMVKKSVIKDTKFHEEFQYSFLRRKKLSSAFLTSFWYI